MRDAEKSPAQFFRRWRVTLILQVLAGSSVGARKTSLLLKSAKCGPCQGMTPGRAKGRQCSQANRERPLFWRRRKCRCWIPRRVRRSTMGDRGRDQVAEGQDAHLSTLRGNAGER